jgi:hypothetical protein
MIKRMLFERVEEEYRQPGEEESIKKFGAGDTTKHTHTHTYGTPLYGA